MIFKIKKDKHYSNGFFHKLIHLFRDKKYVKHTIMFDDSFEYDLGTEDQLDINKLFGYSIGFNHHKNSVRFGWNCIKGELCIYTYCYFNGERKMDFLTTIKPNTENKFSINDKGDYYLFTVIDHNDKITQTKIDKVKKSFFKFNLWPYFGGNRTAPHDIKIFFE